MFSIVPSAMVNHSFLPSDPPNRVAGLAPEVLGPLGAATPTVIRLEKLRLGVSTVSLISGSRWVLTVIRVCFSVVSSTICIPAKGRVVRLIAFICSSFQPLIPLMRNGRLSSNVNSTFLSSLASTKVLDNARKGDSLSTVKSVTVILNSRQVFLGSKMSRLEMSIYCE